MVMGRMTGGARGLGVALSLILASCTRGSAAPQAARDTPEAPAATPAPEAANDSAPAPKAAEREAEPPSTPVTEPNAKEAAAYLRAHLPEGGSVEDGDPPRLFHTVRKGDTPASIAAAYLDLSEIYSPRDFERAIRKTNPKPGKKIAIPKPLTRAIHPPTQERLGWPEDKALRGVFITGPYAGIRWQDTLDKLEERGLNAVVLDSKSYMGNVNYPSKAKIALEAKSMQKIHIPDLARAIRFAHWRGIRVILRIPCFHDPWVDKHLPGARLSLKYTPTGKPIHIDWIDPTNEEAQDYAIELAKEGIAAGADEIQLDYVRFPVHLTRKTAVMPEPKDRPAIIRDFVKRVHAVTKAGGAKLSLDFFGVAATGVPADIEKLGQVIPIVAPEADAISLMSYPSHYSDGYMGFKHPGDHPEIIAIGNKAAIEKLKPTGSKTIFRTWLQAFPWRTTHYGPKYVVAQAKAAEDSGGVGWLMWSPACEYSAVWRGFPKKASGDAAEAKTKKGTAAAKAASP